MFFRRLTDKIIIFNLFGKTAVHLNVTIQDEHDNISGTTTGTDVIPSARTVDSATKENDEQNNCPICHSTPCTCEASGDGNFVL